jgi:ribA/ribD-fused uncharacterized protein
MYKDVDWRTYAVHDDSTISGFFGPYRWLSNFHLCPVPYDGIKFPSAEHAYQAAKWPVEARRYCLDLTCGQALRWGQHAPINGSGWMLCRYKVMYNVVDSKFRHNRDLYLKLLDTGHKELVELNHWGDALWGVSCYTGKGTNMLGTILKSIRHGLRHERHNPI